MFDPNRDLFFYWVGFEPTLRLSDKFRISYGLEFEDGVGSQGYVNRVDDDIIFGERDIRTLENSLSGSYTFNPFHTLALTFRNYWTTVNYDYDLFILQEDGSLGQKGVYNTENIDDPNVNFNTWNLDLSYTWQVAPGSFLTALYRNQLFNQDEKSKDNYFDSLNTLFNQPIEHTVSIRLQYFIDYNSIKGVFKKKEPATNNIHQASNLGYSPLMDRPHISTWQ